MSSGRNRVLCCVIHIFLNIPVCLSQAKRAFDSWNEKKQEANRELSAKKKELMKKEFEKQREKNLKARDAKKYFESWKGKKDEELKEKHQKKREEMKEKKKKEEEEKQETKSNAKKAFENW